MNAEGHEQSMTEAELRTATAPTSTRVPWAAVAVFVAIAFGLAWLVALPLWLGDGLASPFAGVILQTMMFAPAVATVVVTFALRRPPRGQRLRALGMWPLKPVGRTVGFTVAAIFVPPLIIAAAVVVSAALGLVRLDLEGFSGLASQLEQAGMDTAGIPIAAIAISQLVSIPIGAVINAIFAFGEELGWRGWLLHALRPLGTWPALLASGALWGLWHAPVILLGYNFSRPDLLGVLLMVGGCVAWGVLFGWSRLRTGSVWPAVFAHGAINAAAGLLIVFAAAGQPLDAAIVGPLGLVVWGVLAVVVVILLLTGQFRRDVLARAAAA
ncbi:CPBP family intramembrane glutamic endopeptidase [Microbacterium sp. JZ31]|uniref:CPBP family intramembrane glutamic endopeptidase n=1 Tax=Microbacterium sp. JZ31 TaxID=1906274 RepID=UPI001EE4C115|nr:CPBP family intramembrane glutamic endopeptidase [Microbacterium sp. JZ31]